MFFENNSFTAQEAIPWRFEYKYRINRTAYFRLRNALVPLMEPDLHTRRSPNGRYLVRSLYFDNDSYQAYHEKVEGNFGRIKCRIRTYSKALEPGNLIRVELKNRWGESIEKYGALISPEEYKLFMANRHWADHDDPVLREFERIYYLRAMGPKVLVEYYREGYKPRSRDNLRVTLDHDVRSACAECLFPNRLLFKRHNYDTVVVEVKCRTEQPAWLGRLIRDHGLKYVANSKYTQGIEAVRPDFYSSY